MNCGALPDALIENELFGHRRGAFTDARDDQPGLIELARGGTLFLDEIDTLTPKAQVTLLRFLQDQQFRPLGGRREEQADVRIITASNRDVERLVDAGAFRLDLLYRLKLLHLTLPPLRERHGDIALLAEHFVRTASERYGKPRAADRPRDARLVRALPLAGQHPRAREPGAARVPARRRRAHLGRAAARARPGRRAPAPLNYREAKSRAIAEFEARFLANLIGQANGNVSAAARISGTERRHLGRLLKKHQISKPSSA